MILLQNELLEQREGFWKWRCQGFLLSCGGGEVSAAPGSVDQTGLQQGGEEETPHLLLPLEARVEIRNYTLINSWILINLSSSLA